MKDETITMEEKEWENMSQLLRIIYTTAEQDMKYIANGIVANDRKTIAFKALEQTKQYAQAGDIAIRKKDRTTLILILNQCMENINVFFESLQDVPDEL
jgi:hypothetical protein